MCDSYPIPKEFQNFPDYSLLKLINDMRPTYANGGSVTTDEDGQYWVGEDKLVNVHKPNACEGRECVIHNPSDHHMRDWPLAWRNDTGVFERDCPHGIGHPDPDQFKYWDEMGWRHAGVHSCDGCCRE